MEEVVRAVFANQVVEASDYLSCVTNEVVAFVLPAIVSILTCTELGLEEVLRRTLVVDADYFRTRGLFRHLIRPTPDFMIDIQNLWFNFKLLLFTISLLLAQSSSAQWRV